MLDRSRSEYGTDMMAGQMYRAAAPRGNRLVKLSDLVQIYFLVRD